MHASSIIRRASYCPDNSCPQVLKTSRVSGSPRGLWSYILPRWLGQYLQKDRSENQSSSCETQQSRGDLSLCSPWLCVRCSYISHCYISTWKAAAGMDLPWRKQVKWYLSWTKAGMLNDNDYLQTVADVHNESTREWFDRNPSTIFLNLQSWNLIQLVDQGYEWTIRVWWET